MKFNKNLLVKNLNDKITTEFLTMDDYYCFIHIDTDFICRPLRVGLYGHPQMLLNIDMVKNLISIMQHYVDHGTLPEPEPKPDKMVLTFAQDVTEEQISLVKNLVTNLKFVEKFEDSNEAD